MKLTKSIFVVALVLAALAGCGEPRLEAGYEDAVAGCEARYGTDTPDAKECVLEVDRRWGR